MLKIYATTPESEPQRKKQGEKVDGADYLRKIIDTAKWSEDNEFEGTLIYSNNSLVDGWSVAQIVIENTKNLKALVAVNPIYLSPYTLAKRIASLSFMYKKRVDINWIAGGFKNDLKSLGDETPHDERYERLFEYATLIRGLLKSKGLYSYEGKYYKVDKVKMMPVIPEEMIPVELMSGTSEAGIAAADKLGATKVKYAKPLSDYEGEVPNTNYDLGVRFGIIARETSEEAWEIAEERFPDDKIGSLAHVMATNTSDSKWHEQLTKIKDKEIHDVYWLKPFKTYKTFCPYLVGSHEEVANELSGYVKLGHTNIILDIMPKKEDFTNCKKVFDMVESLTKHLVKA